MNIIYREAVEADLPAIVDLLADDVLGASREDATRPLASSYLATFQAIAETPYQRLIVALDGGTVIGTMQLLLIPAISRRGSWRGQIEAVRIATRLRGNGLGKAFINWAIEECRSAGCLSVQLTSDKERDAAHRFWSRVGFDQTHLGFKLNLS